MKFGKSYRENAVPEWQSAYIDYKALKRLIKAIKYERQDQVERAKERLADSSVHYVPAPAAPLLPGMEPASLLGKVEKGIQDIQEIDASKVIEIFTPKRPSSRPTPPPPKLPAVPSGSWPVENQPKTPVEKHRRRFANAVRMVALWRSWAGGNTEAKSPAEVAFLEVLENETRKAASFYMAKVEQIQNQYGDIRRQIAAFQRAGSEATFEARKEILDACGDFVRVLDMLENRFRLLNGLAATKIVKKYDKATRRKTLPAFRATLDQMPGLSSDLLDTLRSDMTALVANAFYGANLREARGRLRVEPPAASTTHHIFTEGLYIGISLTLLAAIALGVGLAKSVDNDVLRALFPVFRGISVLVGYLWCFGAIVFVMVQARINYRFILDIKPDVAVDHHTLFQNCALMTAGLFLAFWLFYSSISSGAPLSLAAVPDPQYIPLYVYAVFAVFALLPRFGSRTQYCGILRWVVGRLVRIWLVPFWLFGCMEVRFSDVWLCDQLTSTVICLTDLAYTYCYYPVQLKHEEPDASRFCGSKAWWTPIIASTPFVLRLLQCGRRAWDLRDANREAAKAQLNNGLKYISSIFCVVSYALYNIVHNEAEKDVFLIAFVLSSVWSTIHKIYWDLQQDWGMLVVAPGREDPSAGRLQRWRSTLSRIELRHARIFEQAWVYWAAIAANVAIRLTWVFQTNPALFSADMKGEALKIALALLECLRRALWNLFRIEYEQLRNCEQHRAFDMKIPLLFEASQAEAEEEALPPHLAAQALRQTLPARLPSTSARAIPPAEGDRTGPQAESAAAGASGSGGARAPLEGRRLAETAPADAEHAASERDLSPAGPEPARRASFDGGAVRLDAAPKRLRRRPVRQDPLAVEAAMNAAAYHAKWLTKHKAAAAAGGAPGQPAGGAGVGPPAAARAAGAEAAESPPIHAPPAGIVFQRDSTSPDGEGDEKRPLSPSSV